MNPSSRPGPVTPLAFDHVGLAVADIDRSLVFYLRFLGFEREAPSPGHPVMVCAGSVRLALVPLGADEHTSGARGDHVALQVSGDRDALLSALADAGVPHQAARGQTVYVVDPDGHTVELVFSQGD